MLECKDKEQACFYLYRLYNLQDVNPRVLRPPAEVETMHTQGRKGNKRAKAAREAAAALAEGEEGLDEEGTQSDCGDDLDGGDTEDVESHPDLVAGHPNLEAHLPSPGKAIKAEGKTTGKAIKVNAKASSPAKAIKAPKKKAAKEALPPTPEGTPPTSHEETLPEPPKRKRVKKD